MADTIVDAVSRALDEAPGRNFRETVDLAVNLRDLDLNDPSKRVDESIVLPSGTGQETRLWSSPRAKPRFAPRKSPTTFSRG